MKPWLIRSVGKNHNVGIILTGGCKRGDSGREADRQQCSVKVKVRDERKEVAREVAALAIDSFIREDLMSLRAGSHRNATDVPKYDDTMRVYKYIDPELFLLLMTSLFTFYGVYFLISFFVVFVLLASSLSYIYLTLSCTLPHILPFVTLHPTLPFILPYHTLPLTLRFALPYLTLRLTLPITLHFALSYLTLPYLSSYITLPRTLPYLTLPYLVPYLTLHFALPYVTSCLTLSFTLPYLTLHLTLPYLTSVLGST